MPKVNQPATTRRDPMKPTLIAISIVLPLLAGAIPNSQAVERARGSFAQAVPVPTAPSSPDHAGQRLSERAGSGRARPFDPCATATGAHGNTATKAVAPGLYGRRRRRRRGGRCYCHVGDLCGSEQQLTIIRRPITAHMRGSGLTAGRAEGS